MMDNLEKRLEVLESKVKLLEETIETIKNMSLSEQMQDYIQKKTKSIKMINLINSMDGEKQLDFEKEQIALENIHEAKKDVDSQIAQAIQKVDVFLDDIYNDSSCFNYEMEDGKSNFGVTKIEKSILSKYEGKGIRIISYNGFDEKRVVIPEKIDGFLVIGIGQNVFKEMTVAEVVLPKSIRYILGSAFSKCKNLKHIYLPETIEYLGPGCFAESGLVDIIIPDSLEMIPKNCFIGCKKLINVKLGIGILKLGEGAFWGCTNLKNISLPDYLLEIGPNCFIDTKINTIIIPSRVEKISNDVFGNQYIANVKDVTCVFLGKDTQVLGAKYYSFYEVSLIYCLPGSNIQQYAREKSIPIKPLSEFLLDK